MNVITPDQYILPEVITQIPVPNAESNQAIDLHAPTYEEVQDLIMVLDQTQGMRSLRFITQAVWICSDLDYRHVLDIFMKSDQETRNQLEDSTFGLCGLLGNGSEEAQKEMKDLMKKEEEQETDSNSSQPSPNTPA